MPLDETTLAALDTPLYLTPPRLLHAFANQLVNAGLRLRALSGVTRPRHARRAARHVALADGTVRDADDAARALAPGTAATCSSSSLTSR